jgi:endonuclease III
MSSGNPFEGLVIGDLFETVLPDFVLAFAFFTSVAYAVLGKRFGQQRPAIAMSATIGFALSVGLVWWERSTGFSVKDLGPIAVGLAVIILALIMYQSIRQVGGSWAGAGIALGASILVAKLLELKIPIDSQVIQTVTIVVLITGILAFLAHRRGIDHHIYSTRSNLKDIRHDMSDLYRDKRLSKRLTKGLRKIQHKSRDLNEHPEETREVFLRLKQMLPAEGYLTNRMAQLRAKAHRIRDGHIARLEETRNVFTKLPASVKKQAAAHLSDRYKQIIGVDARIERLDKAVAETERRIRDLTAQAQRYAAQYDYQNLHDSLKAAEKLQHHNTRLFKLIERTEHKLSAIAKKVAREVNQIEK